MDAQALEDAPAGRAAALLNVSTPPRPPRARRPRGRPRAQRTAAGPELQPLLTRATAQMDALRQRYVRELAAASRVADRRVAALMNEITALRHHEARAEALTRLLAERDTALARQAQRIAELEAALLRKPTQLG